MLAALLGLRCFEWWSEKTFGVTFVDIRFGVRDECKPWLFALLRLLVRPLAPSPSLDRDSLF